MKKVLITDDSPIARMMIAKFLKPLGWEFDEVEDGRAAIKAMHHTEYDIMFLDVTMPDMDGPSTLRAIRSLKLDPHIIVVTANIQEDRVAELVRLGANKIFAKPLIEEELRNHLKEESLIND